MEDDLRDSREQECQAAKTTKKSGARPRARRVLEKWRPVSASGQSTSSPPAASSCCFGLTGQDLFFLATLNFCSGREPEKNDELQRGGARRCCSGFFISSSELSVQHNMSKPGRLRPATSFPGDGNPHDVVGFSFSQFPRFRRGLLEKHAAPKSARVNAT